MGKSPGTNPFVHVSNTEVFDDVAKTFNGFEG